jgi:mannosyltransferase
MSPGQPVHSLSHIDAVFTAYYAFLWIWVHVPTGTVWLRLPSALAAIATVIVVSRFADRQLGRTAGVISGLALATNPFFVAYSVEARPYALEALFLALSTCVLQAARVTDDRGRWLRYALWSLLAIYLHVFAVVVLCAQVSWIPPTTLHNFLYTFSDLSGTASGRLPSPGSLSPCSHCTDFPC